jgi:outer membrane immunogenic protein
MKKIVLSMVAAATVSSVAMAGGDIAPVPVTPVDNWSGFYVGLQAGYNWGDADLDAYNDNRGGHVGTASFDVDGMVAGIYAGYNWLLADDWLIGVEGEWNYVDASDATHPIRDNDGMEVDYITVKVTQDWEASLRARVGKVMGDYLPYITGGIAWTSVNVKADNQGGGNHVGTVVDDDQIFIGWTIGAGVEMAISENLHARVQYRYTDYGDEDFNPLYDDIEGHGNVDYNSHMLTVGLSYRF